MQSTFEIFGVGDTVHHLKYGSGTVGDWNGQYSTVFFDTREGEVIRSAAELPGCVIRTSDFPDNVLGEVRFFTVLEARPLVRKDECDLKLKDTETRQIARLRAAGRSFQVGRRVLNTALSTKPLCSDVPGTAANENERRKSA